MCIEVSNLLNDKDVILSRHDIFMIAQYAIKENIIDVVFDCDYEHGHGIKSVYGFDYDLIFIEVDEEVMSLWRLGIKTTGSCCGHNKKNGYIGVVEADIKKMEKLGYAHEYKKRDTFIPQYIILDKKDIKDLS